MVVLWVELGCVSIASAVSQCECQSYKKHGKTDLTLLPHTNRVDVGIINDNKWILLNVVSVGCSPSQDQKY